MGNGNSNGKKTTAQLDGEINDILRAREKREARTRTSKRSTTSSGIPSQAEYERRTLADVLALRERRALDLAETALQAAAEFFEAMRDHPDIVAERIGWLLAGAYGYGEMLKAKQILGSPRMNRSAALTQLIAAYEWSSPSAMTRASWKKLTKAQQDALERAIQKKMRSAETDVGGA